MLWYVLIGRSSGCTDNKGGKKMHHKDGWIRRRNPRWQKQWMGNGKVERMFTLRCIRCPIKVWGGAERGGRELRGYCGKRTLEDGIEGVWWSMEEYGGCTGVGSVFCEVLVLLLPPSCGPQGGEGRGRVHTPSSAPHARAAHATVSTLKHCLGFVSSV